MHASTKIIAFPKVFRRSTTTESQGIETFDNIQRTAAARVDRTSPPILPAERETLNRIFAPTYLRLAKEARIDVNELNIWAYVEDRTIVIRVEIPRQKIVLLSREDICSP